MIFYILLVHLSITIYLEPFAAVAQEAERHTEGAHQQVTKGSHHLREAEETWAQQKQVLETQLEDAQKLVLAHQVLLSGERDQRSMESNALRETVAAHRAVLEQVQEEGEYQRSAFEAAERQSRLLLTEARQDWQAACDHLIERQRENMLTSENMRHELAECRNQYEAECGDVAELRRWKGQELEARILSEGRLEAEIVERNRHQGRAVLEEEAAQGQHNQRQAMQEELAAERRRLQVQQQEADANLMAERRIAMGAQHAAAQNRQSFEHCESARQAMRAQLEDVISEQRERDQLFVEQLHVALREVLELEQQRDAANEVANAAADDAHLAREQLAASSQRATETQNDLRAENAATHEELTNVESQLQDVRDQLLLKTGAAQAAATDAHRAQAEFEASREQLQVRQAPLPYYIISHYIIVYTIM